MRYFILFCVPNVFLAQCSNTTKQLDIIEIPSMVITYRTNQPWAELTDDIPMQHHRGLVAMIDFLLNGVQGLGDDEIYKRYPLSEEEISLAVNALNEGNNYLRKKRGVFTSAYYSTADGSGQPIVVYLPQNFDEKESWPLLIVLREHLDDPSKESEYDKSYITIRTTGRKTSGFLLPVESDILAIIDYATKAHKVDRSRVIMDGWSAAATTTMAVVSRNPDKFAAAIPHGAFGDICLLPNMLHVPVFCHHGMEDFASAICDVRVSINSLQKLGCNALMKEYEGVGHFVDEPVHNEEWIISQSIPECPERVVYQCEYPSSVYWINILKHQNIHRTASIDAKLNFEPSMQTIIVNTDNINVFELDLEDMAIDMSQKLFVQINNQLLEPMFDKINALQFTLNNSKWEQTRPTEIPEIYESEYRPGASANIYSGEPLMIVFGTKSKNEFRKAYLKTMAQNLSLFGGGCYNMQTGRFPIKADSKVTNDDMKNFNLLLIGTHDENLIIKKILADLPIDIDSTLNLRANNRIVNLENTMLSFIHYNPILPKKLVYLLSPYGYPKENQTLKSNDAYQYLIGSGGDLRGDQADLCVKTFDGWNKLNLQFEDSWKWRDLPGSNKPIPNTLSNRNEYAKIIIELSYLKSDADYAIWWGPKNPKMYGWDFNRLEYFDPSSFTMADYLVRSSSIKMMSGDVSGKELKEIYMMYIKNEEIIAWPDLKITQILDDKMYRMVLHPNLVAKLGKRKKLLKNPTAAPSISRNEIVKRIWE